MRDMLSTRDKLHRQAIEKIRPYIPGKPIEEVERELGARGVIKLASNENPLGPSPLAVSAIADQLEKVHLYPDAAGHYLRMKLSEKLGVSPDHIVLGNGSVEIVEQITEAYLDVGDEAVVGWPAFFKYIISTQIMGGTPVRIPLKEMRYDLPAIADAVGPDTRLIFIANPNNPTGTMVTADEVDVFLDRIPEEVIVVFDEAYSEYLEDTSYPDTLRYLETDKSIIILRTFSKIYGLAGLRIGYGIARPEIISALNRVRETFNTNSIAQTAALHALEDTAHVEMSKSHNLSEKARLTRELEMMGLQCTPSVANFILVDLRREAAELCNLLLQEGVIVRPMLMYELPDCVRLTIGKKDENDRVLETLSGIL
jgi:histidinol-phosphate aminotransferase